MMKFIEEHAIRITVALIAFAALITIGVFLDLYTDTFPGTLSNSHGTWAQFGDAFGGIVGGGFTFLALLALLVTLDVQQRELKETRSVINQQKFESTFFELLKSFNDQINSLDVGETEGIGRLATPITGKKLFSDYAVKLIRASAHAKDDPSKTLSLLRGMFSNLKASHNVEMKELSWSFSLICEFILSSDLEDKDKYTNILIAYLSQDGLIVLICRYLQSSKDPLTDESPIIKLDMINKIRNEKMKKRLNLARQQSLAE